MKRFLQYAIIFLLFLSASFTHSPAQQKETLTRGVVAVSVDEGVFISWRLLADDPETTTFDVYRDDQKINDEPVENSTNFMDSEGTEASSYHVVPVVEGVEQTASASVTPWNQNFLEIPLDRPEGGVTPDEVAYTYSPNDASAGDLDGDGDYEIVLKWDPSNAKDNSQSGHTGNVYLDGYKMDGTLLWRIDLGINIRAGAHYTQFMVYDLDGDGKAEIACKTAPGTRDGTGDFLSLGPAEGADHTADYRNGAGYILDGPEYFTIFDGETGAELATADYIPPRGNVNSWGDDYGNRVDRFLAAIAYLDGEKPSVVMCRGYYTRSVLAAWDWREGSLTQRWVFDSDDGAQEYAGQGNHNLSVADVDDDGKDEIIYGACAIDDDGTGLWTTGLGHGDAMHVSDIDPERPGLERWGITESPSTSGSQLLDAETGEVIWGTPNGDIGRGVSADLVAEHIGMESWGGTDGVRGAKNQRVGGNPSSSNHVVWWDGDLLRELLNSNDIRKYNPNGDDEVLLVAEGCEANNGTKSNPALQADLFGDWREEVIWRTSDNEALRIFTTTDITAHRIITLMHDHVYRMGVAWQNVAYNQPPHTGFYLGSHMFIPQSEWPPSAPANVSAEGLNNAVELNWDANMEMDIAGYLIARSEDEAGPYDTITVELLVENTFTDSEVTNDATYYYAVIAVDTDDNESAYSAIVEVTPTARPDAPEGLYARPGLDEAGLFWNEMGEEIIGYNIYRSDGGDFEQVNDEPVESSSYIDDGLTAGTTYSYTITSLNDELESFQTEEVSVTPGESYTLQAEDAETIGIVFIEDEHAGHNGTGFVNFDGDDSAIEFNNLSGFEGGDFTLEVRYALGNTARTGELSINGTSQSFTMENTEAWTTWVTDELTISFNAGFTNTLRFESTGSDFGNLDQITLTRKTVTAIDDHDGPVALSQNYPNPFSDLTTIEYTIGKPARVEIQIMNMLGQPVRTIDNGMRQPGRHSAVWNAADNSGSRLANGFYLYRIVAGDQAGSLKKMLLISGK